MVSPLVGNVLESILTRQVMVFRPRQFHFDQPFEQLGLTEQELNLFYFYIESQLEVSLNDDELAQLRTLNQLSHYVSERLTLGA